MSEGNVKKRIYGPVPSRRLGYSLGVDCLPYKTCSYDCLYCQLGRTVKTTVVRKPYVSVEPVLDELKEKLKQDVRINYITLGGSGEPTLHSEIGTLIHRIRELTDIPVAVLTNGSMLGHSAVRHALMEADVVLPSLDAHDRQGFETINRPHPSIDFDEMAAGLIEFGRIYKGLVWLEVFVLQGINDTEKDAVAFETLIRRINPDKIHLNTAVRPTAERLVKPASRETLEMFRAVLGKKSEIAFNLRTLHEKANLDDADSELASLLARRPCTVDDLAAGLHADRESIRCEIERLVDLGQVMAVEKDNGVYYQWMRDD